jgi:hypothetical protein
MKYHPVKYDLYYNMGEDTYFINPKSLRAQSKLGIPCKTFASRLKAEAHLQEMGLEIIPSKKGYIAFGIED